MATVKGGNTAGPSNVAIDTVSSEDVQRVKLVFGDATTATRVASGSGLPVDGSGVTQPVSAASLPLPSGAATAAKQPALGTAGTPSADVISIQGVASGTVVPVSDGGGSLTVDGTVGVSGTVAVTQSGTWDEVGINDSGNSITVDNPQLSVVGSGTEAAALRVTIATDSTGVLSVDDNGSTLSIDDGGGSITVDGTVAVSGTVTVAGAVTNAGTFAVQESGAALTALQLIDNIVLAEDAAHVTADPGVQMLAVRKATPANVSGTDGDYEPLQVSAGRLWASATVDAALPAGTNNIGDVDVLTIAAGDNNIGNVDIVTVPAPLSTTGGGTEATALRVTVANDSTGVLSVDDNGGSLTVDGTVAVSGTVTVGSHDVTNAGTFAVQSTIAAGATNIAKAEDAASANADVGVPAMAVQKATPANTAGTDGDYEMLQMSAGRLWASATIDAALPAGTNAIGKLAANSGVDIGDVDVTSVIAGTGATNLGKAEDAAHTTGDVGVMALAVRSNTPTALAGTDLDYAPLEVDALGQLHVAEVGAATLANGQVAPTNTAGTVIAARTGRRRVIFLNYGTVTVYLGIATVTTANGFALDPGASLTLETTALVQGITAAGTGAVHYFEEF